MPPPSPASSQANADSVPLNRHAEIDGIRGWAALCVLLFHLVWEVFGAIQPQYRSGTLHALLDGPLSVYVFFVLSGDALSSCFTDPSRSGVTARLVVKRYFRLVGPIFFSCLMVYVLMRLGLTFHAEAAPLVKRQDWLGVFLPFQPSLSSLVQYGFLDVFANHSVVTSYNPFLWPMGIELVGSMLIFCLGIAYDSLRRPLVTVTAVGALLAYFGSFYALFFVGVALGILRARGVFDTLRHHLLWNRVFSVAAIVLIFILNRHPERFGLLMPPGRITLATALVLVAYASADISRLMRARLSQFLGRISFPLYVTHFAVIVSWTSWCIVRGHQQPDSIWASAPAVIITSSVLALVLATVAAALEGRYLLWLDRHVRGLIANSKPFRPT